MNQVLTPWFALCVAVSVGHAWAQPSQTDTEAYRVYASVLLRFGESALDQRPLVIRSDTRLRTQMSCFPSGKPIENDWKLVMDDFLRQNASKHVLDARHLSLSLSFEIVGWSEIRSGEDTYDGWRNFKARWPKADGYYDVSAVGFDPARNRAIVYIGRHTGAGGEGQYHLLEKLGDWTEITPPEVHVCKGPPFY
jgi:hypothetical protein